jgi:hypothetical protein
LLGLRGVTGRADGGLVDVDVGAAFGEGDQVVDLVGLCAAQIAAVAVALENAAVVALPLPA